MGDGYTLGQQSIDTPSETDRAPGNWFYSAGDTDESLPTRESLLGELITAVSMNLIGDWTYEQLAGRGAER